MQVSRSSRREFIAALGGAAAWPGVVRTQQPGRQYRIAELGPSLENPVVLTLTNAFRARLHELGFVEGQHVIYHRTLDDPRRPSAVVTELMHWQPDLIIAIGTESALQAVASIPIPIVMAAGDYDPIARGYIKSLAKPGGMCQECRSDPNVIDANQAAGRCLGFCFVEQGIELWNSRSGSRRQRARGDGMDANVLAPPLYTARRSRAPPLRPP